MGGQAFASFSPPLFTPRMPLTIYNQILKFTHSILQQHYTKVATPIEAPGKTSYGDVDILVSAPLNIEFDPKQRPPKKIAEALAKAVNARAWIREKGSPTVNLALAWPSSSAEDADVGGYDGEQKEKFVQVDVHICTSDKMFVWDSFHAAHGDLWNILGSTIRPFGLTVNNNGLYLRVPEIEMADRRKSLIFLTDDPSLILDFLGLDEKLWWKSFGSVEEMFTYAAGCRMFWVRGAKEADEEGIGYGDVVGVNEGQEGGERGRTKLKHNDRQRMAKRPVFKLWVDEFIPKCQEQGKYSDAKVSRERIRNEAIETFGIREEYDCRLREFMLSKHKDEIWTDAIKANVPVENVDPQFRAAAVRTLRAIIFEGAPFAGEVVQACKRDETGYYNADLVKTFVMENWTRAGEIGSKILEEKVTEGARVKAEKMKRTAEERNKSVKK